MGIFDELMYELQAYAFIGVVFIIVYIAAVLGAAAISYYLYCLPQAKMAQKLGLDSWMAYLPIARNIQRMRMAGMPVWQLLFVGGSFTIVLALAVIWLFTIILMQIDGLAGFALFLGLMLTIAYCVFYLIYTFKYYAKISVKFGFDAALAWIMLFFPFATIIFTYFMAFYNGTAVKAADAPVARSSARPAAPQGAAIEGISGMYSGAKFAMNAGETFIIGRDGTLSNIVITSGGEKVSKRHCAIRYLPVEGFYEITDFSTNGTFEGNNRLTKDQPSRVPHGTILVIGDKTNQFKLL